MYIICAHDAPTLGFNRFGVQSLGPKCDGAKYALTARALCVGAALGVHSMGPKWVPLCVYYEPTMCRVKAFWGSIDGSTGGDDAPITYVPLLCLNCVGVQSTGAY